MFGMSEDHSAARDSGLERSCEAHPADWLRQREASEGIVLLEAWFHGAAYRPHRHDTYAIGLTETGVQTFDFRGSTHVSLPGNVLVIHPDELHDGRAGSDAGFGYRILYVDPALISAAVQTLCGSRSPLPFVPQPVVSSGTLAATIRAAFQGDQEPLAVDDLAVRLAEGLLAADATSPDAAAPRHLDLAAVERARQFLDAEQGRVLRSWELERVTGLSRYDLARQFRLVVGTSPYRYSLMRRLSHARAQVAQRRPLAQVALDAGFADQAHFTRLFAAAFGITPARYAALAAGDRVLG